MLALLQLMTENVRDIIVEVCLFGSAGLAGRMPRNQSAPNTAESIVCLKHTYQVLFAKSLHKVMSKLRMDSVTVMHHN